MLFSVCVCLYSNKAIKIIFGLRKKFEAQHHMTKVEPGSCSLFETPKCMPVLSFLLASSHYHPPMNFYHISLLLLVVLSAYSESPQHAKPPDSPDPIGVTFCPDSSSAQLGVLAPGLPQNVVYMFTQPNEVYMFTQPNVVYMFIQPNEVYMSTQPSNEVYMLTQPQNEVSRIVLPQHEVYIFTQPQNEVFVSLLPPNGVFILPQNKVLKSVLVNCQLFCNLKIIVDFFTRCPS
jgi:hypothetical protein